MVKKHKLLFKLIIAVFFAIAAPTQFLSASTSPENSPNFDVFDYNSEIICNYHIQITKFEQHLFEEDLIAADHDSEPIKKNIIIAHHNSRFNPNLKIHIFQSSLNVCNYIFLFEKFSPTHCLKNFLLPIAAQRGDLYLRTLF